MIQIGARRKARAFFVCPIRLTVLRESLILKRSLDQAGRYSVFYSSAGDGLQNRRSAGLKAGRYMRVKNAVAARSLEVRSFDA